MGWETDPIVTPAPVKAAWESDPIVYNNKPTVAKGVWQSMQAGYQGSLAGLIDRGKMPDIVLSPTDSKWYERAAAGISQLANEGPEMIAGSVAGTVAGMAGLNPVTAAAAGGAGGFATPTVIRAAYIQAIKNGEIDSSTGFIQGVRIASAHFTDAEVLKQAGISAATGAISMGAGKMVEPLVAAGLGAKVVSGDIGATTARLGTDATRLATEGTLMTLTPAALEGRLPEPREFMDAAILLGGLKAASHVAPKLIEIYKQTGRAPVEVMQDIQAHPEIKQELLTNESPKVVDNLGEYGPKIPTAYKALAEATNAKDAVPDPSPENVKAIVDKPFVDIPQAEGEPILPTHVNYNYLNTTTDVKGALARLSSLYEEKILKATRGTVTNEQTYQEAKQMLDDLVGGKSQEVPLDGADYVRLSADIYAKKQLLISGAERLMTLRDEYIQARKDGNATDNMRMELLAQQERVALALAESRGAQAEVGRALQILKSVNRDKAYYDEMGKLLDSRFGVDGPFVGSAKFDAMVDMMGDMKTPKQALAFAEKAAKATTWEKIVEAWKASILSGPITHIANVIGNGTFMALRPLIDAYTLVPNKLFGTKESMSALEPIARIYGNLQGTIDGAKFAWEIFKGAEVDGKAEVHRKAIEGTLGEVIRTPFRLLGGADAFFRVMNERGEAYSLAVREAAKEGFNIDTKEFRDRVSQLVQDPPKKMQEQINDAGIRFTFNAPVGNFGESLQNLITTAHLQMIIPFVRTPGNIIKEMVRLTPMAPMVKEWRADYAAGGIKAQKAMAEIALGTSISATFAMLTMSGMVSGQGDPDPKKRAIQLASGWQPYSIKVGDTWHSYQRLQPIGTLIGMSADAVDVMQHATAEESDKLGKIIATAFSNAITNQTFLQGITGIIGAISDPDRNGAKYIQKMVASFVPAALGQSAQMMDPYSREVYNITDAIKNRIPGLRESLMPKRDPYGEPVASPERMGGISPIITSTVSKDKVRAEAERLGVGVGPAPKSVDVAAGAKDSRLTKIELTPEQRDVFATASGHMAHQILSQMVEMPMWDQLPNMMQKIAFDNVFSHVKKYGQSQALSAEQISTKAHEIASEIQQRLTPEAIEASKKNAKTH